MSAAANKARDVRLLALDVDGVLSNGTLLYGSDGEEYKGFFTADGLGIKLLQRSGIDVAIITGRSSVMVERRAAELGIAHLVQGREDKLQALQSLLNHLQLTLPNVAYMGDDLPDLGAIQAVGLGMTVADGNDFVRSHADWCSQRPGGRGAVREACEFILRAQGKLEQLQQSYLRGEGE